jgi:signal transduction histidine kinase
VNGMPASSNHHWRSRRFVVHPRSLRGWIAMTFVGVVLVFATDTIVSVTTVGAREAARTDLNAHLIPAQTAAAELTQSLLDQQTGLRGYERTGRQSFLRTYAAGTAAEATLLRELRLDLSGSARASAALETAAAALRSWSEQVAQPGIAAREVDVIPGSVSLPSREVAKRLFDNAGHRIDALKDEVTTAGAAASAKGALAGNRLEWIVWATLGLLGLLAAGVFALLRRQITKPLSVLGKRLEAASSGDLEVPIPAVGPTELCALAIAVDEMRRRLLSQADETLQRSLIAAQDEERRRIAQHIHDDPVQSLTVVSLRLQRLVRRLDDPEQLEMVREAETATTLAIGRLRRLMFELHPAALARDGLVAALRFYLAATVPDDIEWEVQAQLAHEPNGPVQSLAYRLTREAALNALKHADARRLRISLELRNHGIAAVISDDGRGFDPDAISETPGHMGLATTTAMATAAGGWWNVVSAPRMGTTVEFWLPDRTLVPAAAYDAVV